MTTNLINQDQLHYVPSIYVSDNNGKWITLLVASTMETAYQNLCSVLKEDKYIDENGKKQRIVESKIELVKFNERNAIVMKEWQLEEKTIPADISIEEKQFLELFPTINVNSPYYDTVYDVAFVEFGEMFRVNASHEQEALDIAADWAEENGWECVFMNEDQVKEYENEGWEGEIIYAGNFCRPILSSSVFIFHITDKDN